MNQKDTSAKQEGKEDYYKEETISEKLKSAFFRKKIEKIRNSGKQNIERQLI